LERILLIHKYVQEMEYAMELISALVKQTILEINVNKHIVLEFYQLKTTSVHKMESAKNLTRVLAHQILVERIVKFIWSQLILHILLD
jgi:hypothetical protein